MELVCNKRNKFGIGGVSLGIADGIAEKSLQRIQVASVPGYFDGVSDGTFHPAGRGLEGLGHLGVDTFGDGVDHIHIVDGDDDRFPQILITFDVGGDADGVRCTVYGANALVFIKLLLLYQKRETSASANGGSFDFPFFVIWK